MRSAQTLEVSVRNELVSWTPNILLVLSLKYTLYILKYTDVKCTAWWDCFYSPQHTLWSFSILLPMLCSFSGYKSCTFFVKFIPFFFFCGTRDWAQGLANTLPLEPHPPALLLLGFVFEIESCTNFAWAGLLPRSSYRCLPGSWDHRRVPLPLACIHLEANVEGSCFTSFSDCSLSRT
jgi:hypothetical protein